MPAVKSQITEELIQDCILKAVQSVFRTMLHRQATLVKRLEASAHPPSYQAPQILASVGFIGAVDGLIYLCLSDDYAKTISSSLLGMSLSEVEEAGHEVVNDALGEITNMTVGGFKNTLCDVGYPCKLTLPAIVRGQNLTIANVKGATRHVFYFDCEGHEFVADIQIKVDAA